MKFSAISFQNRSLYDLDFSSLFSTAKGAAEKLLGVAHSKEINLEKIYAQVGCMHFPQKESVIFLFYIFENRPAARLSLSESPVSSRSTRSSASLQGSRFGQTRSTFCTVCLSMFIENGKSCWGSGYDIGIPPHAERENLRRREGSIGSASKFDQNIFVI